MGRPRSSDTAILTRDGAAWRRAECSVSMASAACSDARVSGLPAVGERLVGFDDLLHELVPDDVALVEIYEGDSLDIVHDLHRLNESGDSPRWKIDLRDVAGDHGLRAKPEAREK